MDAPSSDPQSRPPVDPKPPAATDPRWRTACRTCGASFKSRNQLMRHLYRSHPGKPGKPKTSSSSQSSPRKPQPAQAPPPLLAPLTLPTPATRPKREQSPPVHPFSLLAQREQLAFAAHVLCAIFTVGVKQQEEEQGQRQKQRDRERDSPPPLLPKDATSPPVTPDFVLPAARLPQSATTDPASHRGTKADDDSELEDSDEDEDGGVALFGAGLGGLSLWGADVEEGGGGRDGGGDGLD